MRILLADDEKDLANALEALLKHEHYSVDTVHDGNSAYEHGLTGDYDCIVLDIMMPAMDGLEVLRRLRSANVSTPILLLTAKSDPSDRILGLNRGADDYLPKPFVAGELIARIRAAVNNKRSYARERLYTHMCCCEDFAVPRLGEETDAERIHYRKLTMRYHDLLSTSPVEIFYCGSIDGKRVARILTDVLATMPRGVLDEDIGTDIRMNALEEQPRYVTETLPVAQAQLAVGYRLGTCMEDPDLPVLFVLNALYGGCVTSKLFLNLRERLSLCYSVGSQLDMHKGLLTVTSGIAANHYERALTEITAQLDAVRSGDFTDEELRCAIRSAAGDLRARADAPDTLAWYWLNRTVQGLDIDPPEMAALVEEVTRGDVMSAAAGIVCDCVYLLKGTEAAADDK